MRQGVVPEGEANNVRSMASMGQGLMEVTDPRAKVIIRSLELLEGTGMAFTAFVGDVVAPPFKLGLCPL